MIRLWRSFLALLERREPATGLALMRVAAGLNILYILLPMLWTGVADALLVDVAHGGMRDLPDPQWLVAWCGGTTPEGIHRLFALGLGAGAALTLGVGGRVVAFAALQAMIAIFSVNPGSGGGHDRLLTNALWLLVLASSTSTLSVDCWLRTRRFTSARLVAAWPRYLAVYQLVIMYCTTGVQKVGADWMPWGGWSAIYSALLLPNWRRFEMGWVGWVYPATQLATLSTWIFEVGAFVWLLALWYRDTRERPGRLRATFNRLDVRAIWALVGLGLHLNIWLFMEVGPFSPVTLSFYFCLWHHDEYAALVRRWRTRRTKPGFAN